MCAFCLLLFLGLFGNGIIGLCAWSADLYFLDLSDLEESDLEKVDACIGLCWIGVDGIDSRLSTCFPDLGVETTLYWFNCSCWAKWAWLEFLGFVNDWLGKVPVGVSLSELASWLMWNFKLDMACVWLLNYPMFCINDAWDLIRVSYSSPNRSISFQQEDFGMKSVELGWENSVYSWEVENC